jgi:hypothetical protein
MEAANRDGDIDYSFHTRPQKEFIQAVQSNYTHKWFEQLPNGLLLAIGSSKTATKCHIPQSGLDLIVGGDNGSGFTIGLSTNVNYKGSLRGGLRRIVSTLYYELLEPLLRDDLEASERLAQQYYFAVVVNINLCSFPRDDRRLLFCSLYTRQWYVAFYCIAISAITIDSI